MATIGLTGGAGSTGGININGTERVTIDTSGNVTLTTGGVNLANVASINGTMPSGYKNKIIGGDFTVNPWQIGASFASPANGDYTADGFRWENTSAAVVTVSKQAAASTNTQHYLDTLVTTIDATIAAGDYASQTTRLEGINVACFGFGVAGTRYVTLSFEHAHTKTGTHCVSFTNSANNRSYVAEYTQSVTNAWETATITVPVDTTGTWLYDTGIGLSVRFALAAGSTFQTTANAWAAGDYRATASQVNNLDSASNHFRIRQVQLEQGNVATIFEQRSEQQELQLCQRYYEVGSGYIAGYAGGAGVSIAYKIPLKNKKRVVPTLSYASTANTNVSVFDARNPDVNSLLWYSSSAASGGTIWDGTWTAAARL